MERVLVLLRDITGDDTSPASEEESSWNCESLPRTRRNLRVGWVNQVCTERRDDLFSLNLCRFRRRRRKKPTAAAIRRTAVLKLLLVIITG
jgi:hypothetical protein